MNVAHTSSASERLPENTILTGDARELARLIPENSVDCVFTDPPYLRADVDAGVYGWLGEEAARALKPGGFALAYTSAFWKPQVLAQMTPHLSYFWDYIIVHMGGGNGLAWGRKTQICYTSIMAFQKARPTRTPVLPARTVQDVFFAGRISKRWHKWGQGEDEAAYYLERFSRPGDLVVDYFSGGGTIATVCRQLGRRFHAFEIDAATAARSRERLSTVQPLLLDVALASQLAMEGEQGQEGVAAWG